ncbi:hypothetical protein Hdeb2414_s0004g00137071 [Helianthus debilis subsp. tardiflorus]
MLKDLETQYEQTMSEIKRLQTKMENLRASDLDSLKTVTLELDGAKESLQKMVDEENTYYIQNRPFYKFSSLSLRRHTYFLSTTQCIFY